MIEPFWATMQSEALNRKKWDAQRVRQQDLRVNGDLPQPPTAPNSLERACTPKWSHLLDALIMPDAEARELLANSVAGIADAFATEVAQLLETIEGV